MAEKKGDLYVLTVCKKLAEYIITVTEKSPKKFRYVFVNRLQNYILDAIEKIYIANELPLGNERENTQKEAKTLLGMLVIFAELAMDSGCILPKQFEYISKEEAYAVMYLNKWAASDKKRYQVSDD